MTSDIECGFFGVVATKYLNCTTVYSVSMEEPKNFNSSLYKVHLT